jgi:peptidyl-prolyl cis-trans isomerase C
MKIFTYSMWILGCFAVVFVVLTVSCRKSKSPEQTTDVNQAGSQEQESVQVPAGKSGVAVTVNGVEIKESEVQAKTDEELIQMADNLEKLPPAFIDQYKKQLREQVLEELIIEQLLSEKVKEENIEITDEEVTKVLTDMVTSLPEPMSLDEYKKKLAEHGQSFDEQKERIKKGLAYQKILDSRLAGKINITEDDARKYYDENPKQFERGQQVRASHILIKPVFEKDGDPNKATTAARAKAQDILKKVKSGADFAQLAMSYSMCPSAPKGGDLGFFSKGDMTPVFEEAAFKLAVGQISDIVETEYGFHIIRATDRREPGVIPFEEIKNSLIRNLTAQKQAELTKEYIESLKAKADIVYPLVDKT